MEKSPEKICQQQANEFRSLKKKKKKVQIKIVNVQANAWSHKPQDIAGSWNNKNLKPLEQCFEDHVTTIL